MEKYLIKLKRAIEQHLEFRQLQALFGRQACGIQAMKSALTRASMAKALAAAGVKA